VAIVVIGGSNIYSGDKMDMREFISFFKEYMLNHVQDNLHSYRSLQLQRINHSDGVSYM
jgi:hypothetical protein